MIIMKNVEASIVYGILMYVLGLLRTQTHVIFWCKLNFDLHPSLYTHYSLVCAVHRQITPASAHTCICIMLCT